MISYLGLSHNFLFFDWVQSEVKFKIKELKRCKTATVELYPRTPDCHGHAHLLGMPIKDANWERFKGFITQTAFKLFRGKASLQPTDCLYSLPKLSTSLVFRVSQKLRKSNCCTLTANTGGARQQHWVTPASNIPAQALLALVSSLALRLCTPLIICSLFMAHGNHLWNGLVFLLPFLFPISEKEHLALT